MYLYIYFFFLSYKLSVPTKVGVTQLRYMTHTARCMCVRDAGGVWRRSGCTHRARAGNHPRFGRRYEERVVSISATYSPGSRAPLPLSLFPRDLRLGETVHDTGKS